MAPYGPYWREMRKMVLQELLSTRRLDKLRHIRTSEVQNTIKELFTAFSNANGINGGKSSSPIKVEMSKLFEQLTLNIIVRKISGKRYTNTAVGTNRDAQFKKVVEEFIYYAGQFVVSDVIPFPFLKWLDLGGHIKSMKHCAKALDACLQIWLDEHKERRMKSGPGEDEQDFIDVLLSKIKDDSMFGFSKETIIKATVMTIIIAGFETSSGHLTWVLSLLLNNPHVMRKAQEEIDTYVGKERLVEESDIKNLVYLQAIVKETLRLYPPGPLSLPRQAMEDCNVGGYLIPKGTCLYVNVWKLHRDPRIWSKPDEYIPERFLDRLTGTLELDVTGNSSEFTFTPFGSGRRSCPGMSMVTQVTHLALARLLQSFDFKLPSDLPVDMSESLTLSLTKTSPLDVLIMPRLPNRELYG